MRTSEDIRNSMQALEKLMAENDIENKETQDKLLENFGKITSEKERKMLALAIKINERL
jgi:hypothetical protein